MVADDSPGHVSLDPSTQQSFDLRWEHYLPDLWIGLSRVYGDRADETLQRIRAILLKRCAERPDDLKRLDEARLLEPDWLQQPTMIGYATYTDHFSGTLQRYKRSPRSPLRHGCALSASHAPAATSPRY